MDRKIETTSMKKSGKIALIYISAVVVFLILGTIFWIIDSPKDEIIDIEVQIDRIERQDASTTIVPLWYYTLHSSDGQYRFYLCGETSAFNKGAFDANVLKNDTLKLKVSKNQYEKNDKRKAGIWTFAVQKDGVDYLEYDKAVNASGINTEKDINTLWAGIIFFILGGIGLAFGLIYFFILYRQGKLFRNNRI
ncbi:hypothetical protein FACS1894211_08380 [Clostridia bacterium]|nr:hypothetical protein FACS1894211_08380 [Clostridia bacterium]